MSGSASAAAEPPCSSSSLSLLEDVAAAALLGPTPERLRFSAGPDELPLALAPPARARLVIFLGGLGGGLGAHERHQALEHADAVVTGHEDATIGQQLKAADVVPRTRILEFYM